MATLADDRQVDGDHYKQMAIEPWELMEAVLPYEHFIGYLKGNIIKYTMRNNTKASSTNDSEKALHYLQKLAEVEGSEEW